MSKRTAFRLLLGLTLVLTAGAAGWSVWWFQLADATRAGIDRWAESRRADGWRVSFAAVTIDGFPGAMRIRLDEPRITRPDGLDWQPPTVQGVLSPLQPQRVRLAAPGRHALAGSDGDGRAVTLHLDLGGAVAELELDRAGRLAVADALLDRVVATMPGAPPVTAEQVRAGLNRPDAGASDADHTTTTAAFTLAVQGLDLPNGAVPIMDRRLAAAALSGRLQGEVPPGDLMPALASWRDQGGTVEIDRLSLDWKPLAVTAEGTLALDGTLQPMLAMSANVAGFLDLVDALTRHGVVKPKDAQVAKLVLGLMAKPPLQGGPPAIQLPVTVQDGRLTIGPTLVGRVPSIPWPAPAAP